MFFRISVIDSEQETIYSVEDDPFDCGMLIWSGMWLAQPRTYHL